MTGRSGQAQWHSEKCWLLRSSESTQRVRHFIVLISSREPCNRAIIIPNQSVRWQRVRHGALTNHSSRVNNAHLWNVKSMGQPCKLFWGSKPHFGGKLTEIKNNLGLVLEWVTRFESHFRGQNPDSKSTDRDTEKVFFLKSTQSDILRKSSKKIRQMLDTKKMGSG